MTIKEILSQVTGYLALSPIANNYYRKSRQWLYHKINEDVINNVQYKLSDDEIDILVSALRDIKNNINNVIDNLEEFKAEQKYLRTPQLERELLEVYKEQVREFSLTGQNEKVQELVRQIYASTTSSYIIDYVDAIIDYSSWHLLNLKNESIKCEGNSIMSIVTDVVNDIKTKIEVEEKKKNPKKKEGDFEKGDDNNFDYDDYTKNLKLKNDIQSITYKIYYQLNKLTPSHLAQEIINNTPRKIAYLGNIEVDRIEKIVCEKISIYTNSIKHHILNS